MLEKHLLTKDDFDNLNLELRELIDVRREEVKRELVEARAQGDLSENADYDAARKKQGQIEDRIKEIQAILSNYEIVDTSNAGDNILIGTYVTLYNELTKKEDTVRMVASAFSDPFKGLISFECPLGAAIKGKHTGDVCEVKAKVNYKVKIVKIDNK